MVGIVHDVEANASRGQPERNPQQHVGPPRQPSQHDEQIRPKPPREHDHGLAIHRWQIARAHVVLLHVIFNALNDCLAKTVLLGERHGFDGVIFYDGQAKFLLIIRRYGGHVLNIQILKLIRGHLLH